MLLIAILTRATFGMMVVAVESAKETHATNRVLADNDGGVLTTGEATATVPLFVLGVMTMDQLCRVGILTVSYFDPEYAGQRAEHSLTIAECE